MYYVVKEQHYVLYTQFHQVISLHNKPTQLLYVSASAGYFWQTDVCCTSNNRSEVYLFGH